MPIYAKIEDGAVVAYPYGIATLRRDNPQVSFPNEMPDERLKEYGVLPVADAPQPASDNAFDVVEVDPVLVAGVWTRQWKQNAASVATVKVREATKAIEAAKATAKADSFVASFIAMTPTQVDAYVETNVTALAGAKALLKKMALILLVLARQEFRE